MRLAVKLPYVALAGASAHSLDSTVAHGWQIKGFLAAYAQLQGRPIDVDSAEVLAALLSEMDARCTALLLRALLLLQVS